MANIVDTWLTREEQIESFALKWKASIAQPSPQGHEIVFETTGEVILDQSGRIRVDMDTIDTARRTATIREPAVTRRIDVFGGKSRTKFHANTEGGFPAAFILNGSTADTGRRIQVLPLGLALRPLDEAIGGFSQDLLTLRDGTDEIGARRCLVLMTKYGTLWISDDSDYLPLRYVEFRNDHLTPIYEINITYRKDKKHVQMPAGWTILLFQGDGTTVYQSTNASVTEYSLNERISDSSFEVEFPPGTCVQNLTTNESFIMRQGKPNRPILPGEYDGKNYNELLNSDPPDLGNSQSRSKHRSLLLWGNLFLAGMLASVIILMRARRA